MRCPGSLNLFLANYKLRSSHNPHRSDNLLKASAILTSTILLQIIQLRKKKMQKIHGEGRERRKEGGPQNFRYSLWLHHPLSKSM
jgi:hypothetical protein